MRQGLPNDLLFPVQEFDSTKPFNDFYKNISRFDMPDAGLEDVANRMAAQGEKIILRHGGRRFSEGGSGGREAQRQQGQQAGMADVAESPSRTPTIEGRPKREYKG